MNYNVSSTRSLILNDLTPFDGVYHIGGNTFHVSNLSSVTWTDKWTLRELMTKDLYLQNRTIANNVDFEASNTVTIGKSVDVNAFEKVLSSGDFIIQSNAKVNIETSQEISLQDGFSAEAGSQLSLSINPSLAVSSSNARVSVFGQEKLQISGKPTLCISNEYSVSGNDGDIYEWSLVGLDNEIMAQSSSNTFTISRSNLSSGQYILNCESVFSKSSKVIYVASVGTCREMGYEATASDNIRKLFALPNPSNGSFAIETNVKGEFDLNIYDVSGCLIKTQRAQDGDYISGLKTGVFILEISNENELVTTKILVE
jgi:hypothetical protein